MRKLGPFLKSYEFKRKSHCFVRERYGLFGYICVFKMPSTPDGCERCALGLELLSVDWLAVMNGPEFWKDFGSVPKAGQGYGQLYKDLAPPNLFEGMYLLCNEGDVDDCVESITGLILKEALPTIDHIKSTSELVDYLKANPKESTADSTKTLCRWISNWESWLSRPG